MPLVGFIGDQRGAAWVQLVISLTMAIIGMPLLMSIEESVENPKFLASNSIWCIQATFIQLKGPTSYGSFFKNPQGGPKRCQITDLEVGE